MGYKMGTLLQIAINYLLHIFNFLNFFNFDVKFLKWNNNILRSGFVRNINIIHSTKFTKKIKVSICSRYFDNFLPLVQSIQQKKFVRRFGQWTNCWRLELWPSNSTSFIRPNDGLFKCIFCHNGARVVGVLARDPIGFQAGQNKSKPDHKSQLLTRLLPSITTCWLDYFRLKYSIL